MLHSLPQDQLSRLAIRDDFKRFQEIEEIRKRIATECYWLGSLMALHNPPFQPDWHFKHCNANIIFPPLIIKSEREVV